MLDLDKYVEHSERIKLLGQEYDILEPNMEMILTMQKIEDGITEENVNQKRVETMLLFVNHNKQGKVFQEADIRKLPFEAISKFISHICLMRHDADKDPN